MTPGQLKPFHFSSQVSSTVCSNVILNPKRNIVITCSLHHHPNDSKSVTNVSQIASNSSSTPAQPALLCLHGFPQIYHIWYKATPFLAERFSVIATDLVGRPNRTTMVPMKSTVRPWQMIKSRLCAHCALSLPSFELKIKFWKQLGYEKFCILGHEVLSALCFGNCCI